MLMNLPDSLDTRLTASAMTRGKSKSALLEQIVEKFLDEELAEATATGEETEKSSYELGEPYFGKYDLGDPDLSVTYKQRIKEKLHAKQHTY
jgi:hypothetical protein